MAQKRASTSDSRPKKRLKSSSVERPKKLKTQPSESKSWKPTRLDSLNWRSVKMPDRLDDVEGFMGLEEVDDVQVANLDGLIEYQVADSAKGNTAHRVDKATTTSNLDDGEEWTGFEDESTHEPEISKQAPDLPEQIKKKKKDKSKKTKKSKDSKTSEKTKTMSSNSFAAIAEEDDDEGSICEMLPLWNELLLSDPTKRGLAAMKFQRPTPIQSSAIPHIIAGHDVIGKASTGSGKTLAFGIPIFEYWQKHRKELHETERLNEEGKEPKADKDEPSFTSPPTALIISPTRELAHQITSHIVDLTTMSGLASPPTTVSVTGGLSLQKQTRQLMQFGGADIVVATPGRLWELLREGIGFVEWIRRVKFLVFDEADRVLQEGHYKEVEEMLNLLQRDNGENDDLNEEEDNVEPVKSRKKTKAMTEKQVLVFSATFSKDLQKKLAGKLSYKSQTSGLMGQKESLEFLLRKLPFREENPKWLDMNPIVQMTANLKEGMVECGNMEKDLYLYYLLLRFPARTLIFTNSISTVRRLTPFLTNLQLPAYSLHSSMIQKARLRSLERFAADTNATHQNKSTPSRQSILISTDVAARGLDIKNVDLIIHYHVPRSADTYVHRSGRTARASKSGVSILLCSPDEVAGVRRLIGKLHDTKGRSIKTIFVDRVLVTRLRTRVELSQKLTSSNIAKDSHRQENNWLKTAAEELGVDYSSDEFTAAAEKGRRGGMKRKAAREVTKDEMSGLKSQLNAELKKMVGSGSRTYITSGKGGHNLAQRLIEGKGHDVFYGEMGLSLDELF